jgi:hypothetical protein
MAALIAAGAAVPLRLALAAGTLVRVLDQASPYDPIVSPEIAAMTGGVGIASCRSTMPVESASPRAGPAMRSLRIEPMQALPARSGTPTPGASREPVRASHTIRR